MAFASYLRTAPATKILPSIVDAAEHDTKLAKLLHAQVHACIMAPLYEVIERARKKAEIGEDQERIPSHCTNCRSAVFSGVGFRGIAR